MGFYRILENASSQAAKDFRELVREMNGESEDEDYAESEETYRAMLYYWLRRAGLTARTLSLETGTSAARRKFDVVYNAQGVWNESRSGIDHWIQIAPVRLKKDGDLRQRSLAKARSDAEKLREARTYQGSRNKAYVIAVVENSPSALDSEVKNRYQKALEDAIKNPRVKVIVR